MVKKKMAFLELFFYSKYSHPNHGSRQIHFYGMHSVCLMKSSEAVRAAVKVLKEVPSQRNSVVLELPEGPER